MTSEIEVMNVCVEYILERSLIYAPIKSVEGAEDNTLTVTVAEEASHLPYYVHEQLLRSS